jgi:hypothetical protein
MRCTCLLLTQSGHWRTVALMQAIQFYANIRNCVNPSTNYLITSLDVSAHYRLAGMR